MRQPSLNLTLHPTHCWTAIWKEKIRGDKREGSEGESRNKESRAGTRKDQCGLHLPSALGDGGENYIGKKKKKTQSGTHYISSHLLGSKECNKKKKRKGWKREVMKRKKLTNLWQTNTKSLRPSLPWSVYWCGNMSFLFVFGIFATLGIKFKSLQCLTTHRSSMYS